MNAQVFNSCKISLLNNRPNRLAFCMNTVCGANVCSGLSFSAVTAYVWSACKLSFKILVVTVTAVRFSAPYVVKRHLMLIYHTSALGGWKELTMV